MCRVRLCILKSDMTYHSFCASGLVVKSNIPIAIMSVRRAPRVFGRKEGGKLLGPEFDSRLAQSFLVP